MLPEEYLLLIDGTSFAHRLFHSSTRTVRQSDGLPVHMLHAFSWSLMKMTMKAELTTLQRNPTYAAMIMDPGGKTMRHEIYEGYKAGRPPMDHELQQQIDLMPELAAALGVKTIVVPGYEADDVLATYARIAAEQKIASVIATSDKDLMQALGEFTFMYDPKKDASPRFPHHILTVEDCLETWGVMPWQMPDLQALTGDAVDAIPGVKGIGPVTAAALMQEYGTLDAIYENLDWIEMPGKVREKLEAGEESARMSRELTELYRDVPAPYSIDDLMLMQLDEVAAVEWLKSMGFLNLAKKIDPFC